MQVAQGRHQVAPEERVRLGLLAGEQLLHKGHRLVPVGHAFRHRKGERLDGRTPHEQIHLPVDHQRPDPVQ